MSQSLFRLALAAMAFVVVLGVPAHGSAASNQSIEDLSARVDRAEQANLEAIQRLADMLLELGRQINAIERTAEHAVSLVDLAAERHALLASQAVTIEQQINLLKRQAVGSCALIKRTNGEGFGPHLATPDADFPC